VRLALGALAQLRPPLIVRQGIGLALVVAAVGGSSLAGLARFHGEVYFMVSEPTTRTGPRVGGLRRGGCLACLVPAHLATRIALCWPCAATEVSPT